MRHALLACVLLVAAPLAAQGDPITLDFNDYDDVMPFRPRSDLYWTFYDSYTRDGVTITGSGLSTWDTMKAHIDEYAYGGTSYELNGSGLLRPISNPLTVTYLTPFALQSVWVLPNADGGPGAMQLDSYLGDQLVASLFVDNLRTGWLPDTWTIIDGVSLGVMDRLVFTAIATEDWNGRHYWVDNLTIAPRSAVPEPATFSLFLVGIVCARLLPRGRRTVTLDKLKGLTTLL